MPTTIELVEGTTGPFDFLLTADGLPVHLSGMTLTLILKGTDGVAVDVTGDVELVKTDLTASVAATPTTGQVTLSVTAGTAKWFATSKATLKLKINNEVFKVVRVNELEDKIVAERAQDGTVAAAHAVSDDVVGVGMVRYTPDVADLSVAKSPLAGRFKVTDALSAVVFFPMGAPDTWKVYRV